MSLAAYYTSDRLVKAYVVAAGRLSSTPNPLIEKSLVDSTTAGGETFFVEAPGNLPECFTSRITDDDVDVMAQALTLPAVFLGRLELPYNLITDTGAQHIAEMFATQTKPLRLASLVLMGNSIGAKGCKALCQCLLTCNMLLKLDLSKNPLGRAGGLAVVDVLSKSPSLQELYLADTEIDIDVLVAVTTALLSSAVTLRILDVENPRLATLQEEHTVHTGRMLRVNTYLTKIHLGKQRMRDEGIRQLVSFLLENKTLRLLDLRCNEIGAAGAEHLSNLLKADCQLLRLNLDGNRIGEKDNVNGMAALAEALRHNRMLKHIDLNHNSLCGEALQLLAGALDRNPTVESVSLFHSNWDQPSSYRFHQILNDRARIMPLRADFITDEVDLRIDVCFMRDFEPNV